ncbi:MAG: hypothetical protein QF886_14805 [Planctomycetota bacterium]|nr:hypothetical protein [Planctomycetota bacterium]
MVEYAEADMLAPACRKSPIPLYYQYGIRKATIGMRGMLVARP